MYHRIPDYLLKIGTNIKILIFVAIFSLIFVNIYSPFIESTFYTSSSSMHQFLYSTISIFGGIAILLGSRLFMCGLKKKLELTVIQYCLWLLCEIFLIALLYTIIITYLLKDQRSFAHVFQHSLIFVPLLLSIPYIVSYLYLALKDRDVKINHLTHQQQLSSSNEETATEESVNPGNDDIINFVDEKDNLKLSVKQEYIYYLESANNYVNIYYIHNQELKRFMIRNTLKNLESMLQPYGFVRCHRSYIVNVKKIKIVRNEHDTFYLDLDQDSAGDIPISKTYAEQIMKLFSTKI